MRRVMTDHEDWFDKTKIRIRFMIRRDMAEVLVIEAVSFEFPWLEEDFKLCLRQPDCIGMVAEYGDRVVGFMIYDLYQNKVHLLSLAVSPTIRRRGIGTQLVEKLTTKLGPDRRTCIESQVRETNLAAQLFFKSQGFLASEILPDFYDESIEAAYHMSYVIPEYANQISPFFSEKSDR